MFKKILNKLPLKTKNENFPLIILGHLTFAILFLFSIYFYKERILFTDSAFQFFKIINFGELNIEAHRYGAILPQFPILFLNRTALNLKYMTIVYSCSFILLYYIVYLICTYYLKNKEAGFSIVLILTVCISQSFFHPVTETHQSLVFTVLLYTILRYNEFPHSFTKFFFSVFVIIVSFLAHPVALYTTVFVIGYAAIKEKQVKSLLPYSLLTVAVLMTIAKVMLTQENSYEGQFFSELLNSPEILLSIHKTNSLKFFVTRISSIYFWLVIMELILVVYLIYKKNYIVLFWQLIVISGFMLITVLTYNKGDASFMMDRAFMPLALFIAIPFLHELQATKNKTVILKLVFLSVVVCLGLNRIYNEGSKFKARTQFNQNLLQKTAQLPSHKIIMNKKDVDQHILTFWSHPFEILILSAITADTPTQTIFLTNNTEQLKIYTEGDKNSTFLGTDFWLEWNINSLNPKYFKLPNDQPYCIVNFEDL